MDTIEQEVKRIKNELADLGCQMMYGKSAQEIVQELIQEILAGMAEQVDARDLKSLGFDPCRFESDYPHPS